jgi:hypothetical protein
MRPAHETRETLMSHQRSTPARRLAATVLATLLTLTACSSSSDSPGSATSGAASGGTTPTGAGGAAPASLALDPTVGLTLTGWLDAPGAFAGLPLADTGLEDWPELFAEVSGPSGPLTVDVTTVVERDPDACTVWRVLVTDVSFGDGPAAERMRATVLATLSGIDHDPGPLLGTGEEPWCGDREREGLAWYATVLAPAFCTLPGEDPLQCLTVVTMRYDGGAHPNLVHTDLVFDAATGTELDVEALLARRELELGATTAFIGSTVCELDVAAGLLGAGEDCWPVVLRNARPTPTGLVLSFAPYESGPYALGPRDLFVPWGELDAGAAVPVAARAAQRELRAALAADDWSLVAALLPADGDFLVATGEAASDPVAVLRALPRDPRPEMLAALAQRPGRIAGVAGTVWPELAVRDPFVIAPDERASLEATFGADTVRAWESAGRYTGWRAGFDDDGTWRFMVAGS